MDERMEKLKQRLYEEVLPLLRETGVIKEYRIEENRDRIAVQMSPRFMLTLTQLAPQYVAMHPPHLITVMLALPDPILFGVFAAGIAKAMIRSTFETPEQVIRDTISEAEAIMRGEEETLEAYSLLVSFFASVYEQSDFARGLTMVMKHYASLYLSALIALSEEEGELS